jgi:hypothetical protein
MADRTTIEAEHEAALTRLLALGLAAAEHLQGRLLAATTDEEAQGRTLAFTRAARSVRQTIALRAQLLGAGEQARRQADAAAREAAKARVERQKAQVGAVLTRLVWDEREGAEAEALEATAEELLSEEAALDGFAEETLEALVARLAARLGLAVAVDTDPADPNTTRHPGEGRDPSGTSTAQASGNPGSAWVPASAGMTAGEGAAEPASPWAGTWSDSS